MFKTLKPSEPGLLVRDHQNSFRPLPDAGKEVLMDFVWIRRLNDGDVVEVKSPSEEPAPEAKAPDESKGKPEDSGKPTGGKQNRGPNHNQKT
ncbi:MAG: DUF2635 domain-containing protein [Pseudomonadota bacterium]